MTGLQILCKWMVSHSLLSTRLKEDLAKLSADRMLQMAFEICHYVISQHVTHKMSEELHDNAIIQHPIYLFMWEVS